jgi:hypothetical protein
VKRPPARGSASISADGRYRYDLTRRWGDSELGPLAVFIMLNPSTADAGIDDPTVGRCRDFARSWGFDGLRVLNAYALRSTDPRGLWLVDDPVGPGNNAAILAGLEQAARDGAPVVVAWGVHARLERAAYVHGASVVAGVQLECLGTTKAGAPRHPLYLRGDTPREPWPSQ